MPDLDLTPRCLQEGPDCNGPVQFHWTPDREDGKAFPRCEHHFHLRLEQAEEHNRKYPKLQPADFDPSYAGEVWSEEDY